jgi:hypothetical protein
MRAGQMALTLSHLVNLRNEIILDNGLNFLLTADEITLAALPNHGDQTQKTRH